jgi:hypothetical protein
MWVENGNVKDVVGKNVNSAARIEPVVEPNEVFCSETLYQLLSSGGNMYFKGVQLGRRNLAKDFGEMELYKLLRSQEGDETPAELELPDPPSSVSGEDSQPQVSESRHQPSASSPKASKPKAQGTQPKLSPTDRLALIQKLNGLPQSQLNQVIFALNPPSGVIPYQGDRVSALLVWAGGTGGCGLVQVQQALEAILNPQ